MFEYAHVWYVPESMCVCVCFFVPSPYVLRACVRTAVNRVRSNKGVCGAGTFSFLSVYVVMFKANLKYVYVISVGKWYQVRERFD